MNNLETYDLSFCIQRLPKRLKKVLMSPEWAGKVFVGGGFIRSVITGEPVNDIDLFLTSPDQARELAFEIVDHKRFIHKTENALTLTDQKPTIQIIHKWNFQYPKDVIRSFDFTVCAAVIWFQGDKWWSLCDPSYYADLAAKRLVYKSPKRIEEAGGSTLRVLKYYQKGYRIPVHQYAGVLARLFNAVDMETIIRDNPTPEGRETAIAKVVSGLLRTVDPLIDPTHEAHLPSTEELQKMNEEL